MEKKMYEEYKGLFLNNEEFKDEKYFSFDGIIDIELFSNAKEKILWILKEPYKGNLDWYDFNYSKYINNFEFGESVIYDTSPRMWHNITHVNYCIYHKKNWEEIDNCWEEQNVYLALHHSALINLKKIQGKTSSNYFEIQEHYQIGKNIILQQIEDINPTVIICGGTFKFIKNDLVGLEKKNSNSEVQWDSYLWKNRILIDAYHPSARYEKEKYCDKIINAYRNLRTKS